MAVKNNSLLNILGIEKQHFVSECPKCAEFKTMNVSWVLIKSVAVTRVHCDMQTVKLTDLNRF